MKPNRVHRSVPALGLAVLGAIVLAGANIRSAQAADAHPAECAADSKGQADMSESVYATVQSAVELVSKQKYD